MELQSALEQLKEKQGVPENVTDEELLTAARELACAEMEKLADAGVT